MLKKSIFCGLAAAWLAFSANHPVLADDSEKMKEIDGVVKALETVGKPFSQGQAEYISLAQNSEMLYAAFRDDANGNKVTVMRHGPVSFTYDDWQVVGTQGFSPGEATFVHLAFNGETPYVAYEDYGNGHKLTVMKFDGKEWAPVGPVGFCAAYIPVGFDFTCFNGEPYLAYADSDGGKLVTFDGNNWVPAFNGVFQSGPVEDVSLAFEGTNNVPWIAFSNGAKDDHLTVKAFYDGQWGLIEQEGFSTGSISYPRLMNDAGFFVAFKDSGSANGANPVDRVMEDNQIFESDQWVDVANPLPPEAGSDFALALRLGRPCFAYLDGSSKAQIVMSEKAEKDLHWEDWRSLDRLGFSTGPAQSLSMIYDEKRDKLYLAYADGDNGYKGRVVWVDPK